MQVEEGTPMAKEKTGTTNSGEMRALDPEIRAIKMITTRIIAAEVVIKSKTERGETAVSPKREIGRPTKKTGTGMIRTEASMIMIAKRRYLAVTRRRRDRKRKSKERKSRRRRSLKARIRSSKVPTRSQRKIFVFS